MSSKKIESHKHVSAFATHTAMCPTGQKSRRMVQIAAQSSLCCFTELSPRRVESVRKFGKATARSSRVHYGRREASQWISEPNFENTMEPVSEDGAKKTRLGVGFLFPFIYNRVNNKYLFHFHWSTPAAPHSCEKDAAAAFWPQAPKCVCELCFWIEWESERLVQGGAGSLFGASHRQGKLSTHWRIMMRILIHSRLAPRCTWWKHNAMLRCRCQTPRWI